MKPSIYSLLSILLFPALTAHGADNIPDAARTVSERVVEPSPDVATARRYADFPVSYATGSASVSLPLMTLSTPTLSVSLGLDYRCEAKRVDEPAGWVGLGWTLTGLGSVSRQICGMPDDWHLSPLDLRAYSKDVDYYNALLDQKKDAQPDRYTVTTPDGASVSFMILKYGVELLGYTELRIDRVEDPDNEFGTEKFIVTSPDGTVYEYAEKERIEYLYDVEPKSGSTHNTYYTATSAWHLTKIVAPERSDSIMIDYAAGTTWTKSKGANLFSRSHYWKGAGGTGTGGDLGPGGISYDGPVGLLARSMGIPSTAHTTYLDQPLPAAIRSATGRIDFEFAKSDIASMHINGTADKLKSVRLTTPGGTVVRRAEFEAADSRYSRRTLDKLSIYGETGLVEGYRYTYFGDDDGYGDVFGYPNGSHSGMNPSSILDDHLGIRATRSVVPSATGAALLRRVTDHAGIATDFEYEPSVASLSGKNPLWGSEIAVGTRIKSITATDLATGRYRRRDFAYYGDTLDIDMDMVYWDDYLAPSGTCQHSSVYKGQYSNFNMSVTYTASSRRAGRPVESARVYYRAVEETLSGSGMGAPVKTRYEYDVSQCVCRSVPCGSASMYQSKEHTNPLLDRKGYFDSNTGYTDVENYRTFNPHLIINVFVENIGAEPMLSRKVSYRALPGGGHEPWKTEEYTYSVSKKKDKLVGLFYESIIYQKYLAGGAVGTHQPITEEAHINHGPVYADYCRVIRTGATTRLHFPGGMERTMRADYHYFPEVGYIHYDNADSTGILGMMKYTIPGFPVDSTYCQGNGPFFRPRGVTYSCGGESLGRYNLYSRDIHRTYFQDIPDRYLPVAQKWIAAEGGRRDSLETAWLYGKFHGMTRAVRETVSRHGAVLDMAAYTAYDALGLPTAMTRRNGSEYAMTWDGYGNLTSRELVGPGLESSYTYKPLVGCTSVTYPSGRRKYFSYDNGRLSQVRNTSNQPVSAYSYAIANEALEADRALGENAVTTTAYTASGEAVSRAVYDGFGMKTAEIATLGGSDVETKTEYDALDRAVKLWQPLPSGQTAQSYYGDAEAFTLNAYDTDGSQNITSSTAPGRDMQGHAATNEYLCNTQSGELRCRHFVLEGDRLVDKGAYADAALDVVRATDADGHRVLTFTDWRGRAVLVRKVLGDNKYIDTHTLYDAWGDVLLVLQPEGVAAMQAGGSWDVSDDSIDDVIEKYAYVYRYDDALRPVYAKLPGVDPVTTAYDPDGLAAYTVDGNLRSGGRARFTLYDSASRPVVTGICDEPAGEVPRMRATLGSSDPGLDSTYYATVVPLTGAEVYTATYYDNYGFVSLPPFAAIPAVQMPTATAAAGLVTATLDRVLDGTLDPGRAKYVATVNTYDAEERPIKTVTAYHDTGICAVSENSYNIDGTVSTCTNTLLHPYDGHNDSHVYSYDAAGRLLKEAVSYDGGEPVTVQQLSYNAIGQLAANDLGAFTEAYTYNVRGAMTGRKSDVFEQNILFTGKFNGSIASINDKLADGLSMTSWYTYDKAGRLTKANMKVGGTPRCVDYTYDLNGNITSLVRDGDDGIDPIAWIDNMTYQYDGNKVRKITDTNGDVISERTMDFPDLADLDVEYSYDRNGNMTWDANRGVHMQWDANNRLSCAYYNPGVLSFTRSATGRRLSRSYSPNQSVALVGGTIKKGRSLGDFPSFGGFDRPGQDWFPITDTYDTYGSYEYENSAFSRLNTTTGYRDSLGVHVYVRDWQGNIRAVVRKGADGRTILEQATYYYPYGMPMAESTNPTINRYKYTGKELLTDHGVNILDYGPRPYDPTTGLWLSPDPHSADYAPLSHYSMCAGDPINFVDENGMDIFRFSQMGELLERIADDTQDLIQMQIGSGEDMQIIDGPQFEYGTISIRETIKGVDSETNENIQVDVYDIKGDANGQAFHEFMSENGYAEFARFATGEAGGDNALNILFTSHQADEVKGVLNVAKEMERSNMNVRQMIHNHPSRTIDYMRADIATKLYLSSNFKSFQNTTYQIYLTSDYGQKSKYYDYTKRIIPGIMPNRTLPSIR